MIHSNDDKIAAPNTQRKPKVLCDTVRAYYDPKSATYWIPALKGWTRVKTIRDYLIRRCGIIKDNVPEYTLRVQEQHSLIYVGALAGRKPGILRTKDGLVLVTAGFTLIAPKKGDWAFIERMLKQRMGEEQIEHFHLYMKRGYEDLRDGKMSPGLFLAIVGPVNMHKTCVQELIITPIFGGRPGEPHQFFTQGTEFNGDFIGSEHLIITDADVKRKNNDVERNTHFGTKVKQYCGTSSHRIHPKGRDAFQALAFWRISQSCNDTYPHILALPDLGDPTVADKVLLIHFDGEPFDDWMPSNRNEIKAKINQALPGYVHHLVNMPVQEKLFHGRFGQKPYKNQLALDKYFSLTQEAGLLELIDEALFKIDRKGELVSMDIKKHGCFRGYAKELESTLRMHKGDQDLEKIGATGHQLGKMLHAIAENPSTKHRMRITKRKGRTFYYIFPPQKCDEKVWVNNEKVGVNKTTPTQQTLYP
jgi:hypothetical protein